MKLLGILLLNVVVTFAQAETCTQVNAIVCTEDNTQKYSLSFDECADDESFYVTRVIGTPYFGYDLFTKEPKVRLFRENDQLWHGKENYNRKNFELTLELTNLNPPYQARLTKKVTSDFPIENEYAVLTLNRDLCVNECTGIQCAGVD